MTPARFLASLFLAGLMASAGVASAREPLLAPTAIQADLDELVDYVERTHPDLDYVADPADIERQAATIRSSVTKPMNVREAWMELARLNPYFADAHTGLRHPVTEFDAYRETGGAVFPLPVFIDREGMLRVAGDVKSDAGVKPFERILSINGQSSEEIVALLMPRMRGETESLRRLVLAFNFPAYLWTAMGPAESYLVEMVDAKGGHREVRLPDAASGSDIASPSLSFPQPGIALMRVPSFDPSLRGMFATFLDESIAEIAARGATTLLIDIRDNPGGAHDVSDQLIAWLTDRPVSPTSALTARITADNKDVDPDAAIGSVVTVAFDEPIAPRADGKRFGGNVYVLVSEDSYSQAIVFATTIKDHGLGKLVGEQTGGAANQTGQITLHPLTHTGMQALAPLYVIYRASGDRTRAGLAPDIPLAHDPAAPGAMIDRLLTTMTGSLSSKK